MLEKNSFVVRQQTKLLSARDAYDILDAESGQPVGSARPKVSGLMTVLGLVMGKDKVPLAYEVRTKPDDKLAFAVRRRGLVFKKIEAVDAEGRVVGRFKAKRFSLAGGFHVYDKDGKHVAEIKGKLLKSEYRFLSPGGAEMGSVSRKWGGMAKELLTSAHTYGVKVDPAYAADPTAKILILGAALAIDTLFKKDKAGAKGGGAGGGEGGGDDE